MQLTDFPGCCGAWILNDFRKKDQFDLEKKLINTNRNAYCNALYAITASYQHYMHTPLKAVGFTPLHAFKNPKNYTRPNRLITWYRPPIIKGKFGNIPLKKEHTA